MKLQELLQGGLAIHALFEPDSPTVLLHDLRQWRFSAAVRHGDVRHVRSSAILHLAFEEDNATPSQNDSESGWLLHCFLAKQYTRTRSKSYSETHCSETFLP